MSAKPARSGREKKCADVKMAAAAGETETAPATMSAEALAQISASVSAALDDRLIKLQTAMEDIKSSLEGQAKRLEGAEQRISGQEDKMVAAERNIQDLIQKNAALLEKLEDQENRSRRNNVKIIGLPETLREDELYQFIESWLPEHLDLDLAGDKLRCERVHRMGPLRDKEARPRPVMAKILNWAHKAKIFKAYRQKASMEFQGKKILLFNDFSAHVAAQRREMAPACSELHRRGIRFALLFPARLRVQHLNTVKFFNNKEEATAYVSSLERPAEG